jgi:hypothetical protein
MAIEIEFLLKCTEKRERVRELKREKDKKRGS